MSELIETNIVRRFYQLYMASLLEWIDNNVFVVRNKKYLYEYTIWAFLGSFSWFSPQNQLYNGLRKNFSSK